MANGGTQNAHDREVVGASGRDKPEWLGTLTEIRSSFSRRRRYCFAANHRSM